MTWREDLKFRREKHLAGDASKSYSSRRRATRRVEELLVVSKSYTSRRRASRRVEELHVASKRPGYARRVEEVRTRKVTTWRST